MASGGANTRDDSSSDARDSDGTGSPKQLQAGLFPPAATVEDEPGRYELPHSDEDGIPSEEHPAFAPLGGAPQQPQREHWRAAKDDGGEIAGDDPAAEAAGGTRFSAEETVLIFDWDDTLLPSTWVQRQGLRLDEGSKVSAWQREQLAEVATAAAETLRAAKRHGTVVLVTNAERGWIELSCQKFLPELAPSLESLKIVSARTSYESPECADPCDWKLHAFEREIRRIYGSAALVDHGTRKNVLSLGDSVHEREALHRATALLPSCRAKSLKFVERPDIAQICKQLSLVAGCFDNVVHHDGNLDLCIRCA